MIFRHNFLDDESDYIEKVKEEKYPMIQRDGRRAIKVCFLVTSRTKVQIFRAMHHQLEMLNNQCKFGMRLKNHQDEIKSQNLL